MNTGANAATTPAGGNRQPISTSRRQDAKAWSGIVFNFAPLLLCVFALSLLHLSAATNDLSGLLQKGLFEEEANRDLAAAAQAYQALSARFDQDRKLAATAIFRLGEVYRKQGKTNEATAQYERIVREFADETVLATLSRQNLSGLGARTEVAVAPGLSQAAQQEQKRLLAEEIKLVEQELAETRQQVEVGRAPQQDVRTKERELLQLRRQIAGLEVGPGPSDESNPSAVTRELLTPDVEEEEIRRLQAMIQNSPDLINAPREGGMTPLARAAHAGWLRVARFLLDQGAAIDRASQNGTPLHHATAAGHKAMVELLLERGADVNAKDGSGGTALHTAAQSGFLSIAQVLLTFKADLNARNSQANKEQTPLHRAVAGGHQVMTEFLVERGADANARAANGHTPVFDAVAWGHSEVLARLLALGAKPDVMNNNGRTALSHAAEAGHLDSVTALLAAKADPNAGRSDLPLHRAIHIRSPAIVELLLQAGADATRITDVANLRTDRRPGDASSPTYSYTGNPLDAATRVQDPALVKLLLRFKADPNGPCSTDGPFVVRAANHSEILKLLLEASADPNGASPDGEGGATALHAAVAAGNRESAKLLLEHGARPNVTALYGQHGVTPLMLAANKKDAELVELLLKHKADPNLVDARGNTALLNAVLGKAPEVVRALLAGGANPDTKNAGGYPVLTIAVTDAANREVAAALLEAKANVNAPDPAGKAPLHWAAETKRNDLVELFINAGADVNLRDKSGKTPLDYAKQGSAPGLPAQQLPPRPVPGVPIPHGAVTLQWSGTDSKSAAESAATDVTALLRQRGALDDMPDFTRIRITRQGFAQPLTVFSQGPKLTNQFTLLETVMSFYSQSSAIGPVAGGFQAAFGPAHQALPFPDFGRILIRRPDRAQVGKEQEIKVSLLNASNVVDCAKDVPVEFGDVIEIPERVHALNEAPDHPVRELERVLTEANRRTLPTRTIRSVGDPETNAAALTIRAEEAGRQAEAQRLACLLKSVQLVVAGETTPLTVTVWQDGFLGRALARPEARAVLRSSSDLSRVKVTRRDARTGQTMALTVDVSESSRPEDQLWLQDGDVIEVPDKP
jgi:ankyrin repeat protein